ncbi:MAG: haloacid dehalogenase type II [Gemmatimonadetes bacterium]|nr:haloacid dehalogenase type II [Gemmatimonadota bacterium]MDA1103701.1 haloacid dehalogenase type II [Gemmatimonadota bacterium]
MSAPIDFHRFEALTFDCYGTLIDWERGIQDALSVLLEGATEVPSRQKLLELFGRYESEAEHGSFKSYRQVLTAVALRMGAACGLDPDRGRADGFAASVGVWPPFPDTVDALRALSERYRLAIVSNVDDDLFAKSADMLGVSFSEIVTAQQVESYKPAPAHFLEALRRLDLPVERVLHVAQSLYHDIAPAKQLGLTCVWVNRRAGRAGGGATPPAVVTPDLEVPDLASLARLVRAH